MGSPNPPPHADGPPASQLRHIMGIATATVIAAALAACAPDSGDAPQASWPGMVTADYLPGLAADVHVPATPRAGSVPVVVLVPGGGWQTADRTGLSPLAAAIADAGMLAVSITYAAGRDGAMFPEPVQDVICATGFATERARQEGLAPGPLVLVGHSAGGHLAALAATAGADLTGACPYPTDPVDGLVGLAGVYSTADFEFGLVDFFGAPRAEALDTWTAGDPVARVEAGRAPPGLEVLLRHGEDDVDVPLAQSQAFAAALEAAGIPVRLDVLPGVDHASVYTAEVSAEPVVTWIDAL